MQFFYIKKNESIPADSLANGDNMNPLLTN
jgi:hypothetical protein